MAQRVRIVAKVRSFSDSESRFCPEYALMTVHKLEDDPYKSVEIFLHNQRHSHKDGYRFHSFYGQEEGSENIYKHEIKPLLQKLFQGFNASVLAYGTRGSGKTVMIQGSEKESGLASLAMDEILAVKDKLGVMVSISCYEIHQDKVYDLLDPKKQEIMVLENSYGKIQLKGLSKIQVNSLHEFSDLCREGCNVHKSLRKNVNDIRRAHKGLTIYTSYIDTVSGATIEGKINFVDLAGYEDVKLLATHNPCLAESAKINNKSLYALQNVVYAINLHENRVPFRECKLTHLLQDSLDKDNHAVIITCLKPAICPDTIYTITLSSRSCYPKGRNIANKSGQNRTISAKSLHNPSVANSKTSPCLTKTARKSRGSLYHSSDAKIRGLVPHGRKEISIFGPLSKQGKHSSTIRAVKQPCLEDKGSLATVGLVKGPNEEGFSSTARPLEGTSIRINEECSSTLRPVKQPCLEDENISLHKKGHVQSPTMPDPSDISLPSPEVHSTPTENGLQPVTKQKHSPLLSETLREITNTMRSFYAAAGSIHVENLMGEKSTNKLNDDSYEQKTPFNVGDSSAKSFGSCQSKSDFPEPETPVTGSGPHFENCEFENMSTPHDVFQTALKGFYTSQLSDVLEPRTPVAALDPHAENCVFEDIGMPRDALQTTVKSFYSSQLRSDIAEPKTPVVAFGSNFGSYELENLSTPRDVFRTRSCGLKKSLVKEFLRYLNTASKEELKELQGIGDKRAAYILDLREESPEPFKELDDLKSIGLSAKQINRMMKKTVVTLFD